MNEILEKFIIKFDVDNEPLKKGLEETKSSALTLGKALSGIFAGFVSYSAIKTVITDYANFNNELAQNTELLGLNVEEVTAIGGALEYFGGDVNSAVSSLSNLSKHLEQATRGQGALIEVSKKYGLSINPYSSSTEALNQLSNQLSNYSATQRVAIAEQLGLDEAVTRAFSDPKAFNEYLAKVKELGTTTQEDIEISKAFKNAQVELNQVFGALTREIGRVLLPVLTKLTEIFTKFISFLREHKELVTIFFIGMGIAMLPILVTLGKMAIASAVAFAPFFAIGAVLVGLSLIFEDIYFYFKGYDSVTGDLIAKFPLLGSILEPFRAVVQGIEDIFVSIFELIQNPSWGALGDVFLKIGETIISAIQVPLTWVSELLKSMGVPVDEIFEGIKNLGSGILEFFLNPIKEALNVVKSVGGFISSIFGGGESKQPAPAPIPTAPTVQHSASTTTNNQSNNYNVNNNFNQQISTATPTQFADQTNSQIAQSITNARLQNGSL